MDLLTFTYKLSDSKGNFIESAREENVLNGSNKIVKGLETALNQMTVGETKKVPLKAIEGFGEYSSDLVFEVDKTKLGAQLKEGDSVAIRVNGGKKIQAKIVDFKDRIAILDGNHPLAGMDLIFDVTLLEKRPAPEQEIQEKE